MNENINVYDLKNVKFRVRKIIIPIVIIVAIISLIIAMNVYLNIIELNEIGQFSGIYLKNLFTQIGFFGVSAVFIFIVLLLASIFVRKNITKYYEEHSLPKRKINIFIAPVVFAIIGAFMSKEALFLKYLQFSNSTDFGKTDPIFNKDIGYYIFQRPFLMEIYNIISSVWFFTIIFTIGFYLILLLIEYKEFFNFETIKVKLLYRHNLINVAVFFFIKAFSYKFKNEGILYSTIPGADVQGASYTDVTIWLQYFKFAPYLLILITIISMIFLLRKKLKQCVMTILLFPAVWLVITIVAVVTQQFFVAPTMIEYQSKYTKYNMEKTREAYNLDNIKEVQFPETKDITTDLINRNAETVNNIRVVDYKSTLESNKQLQNNANFYTFNNGDIVNYKINGKETPVFTMARETDKSKLPPSDASNDYIIKTFKYTHGYGMVINPINSFTSDGQVEFYLSGLKMDSVDPALKITQPRIYYGELTNDHVIVNGNGINEIDLDGNSETNYSGTAGIKLGLLNKMLYTLKYGDFNMLISKYVSTDSKLLLNRNIIDRVNKAVPFITFDNDPYIVSTSSGGLAWIIDGYTTSGQYPYSQYTDSNTNYIRNSVKAVIDAYNGSVKLYIIDKKDPIIETYSKIYPDVFTKEPLPVDIAEHSKYPENLFIIQSEMLKNYHLNPNDPINGAQNVKSFFQKNDLWDIAQYPQGNVSTQTTTDQTATSNIEPYYNMIKLPGGISEKEELILMRPYTPYQKNNMVAWLSVRNSVDNYGELVVFNFPKNKNILGPNQIAGNINQIDELSKDMSLWNQSGSTAYKGNLLVIPIEDSILYVESIYIQAAVAGSAPHVKKVVVGYQRGDEFKSGYGATLKDALKNMFDGAAINIQGPATKPIDVATPGATGQPQTTPNTTATTPSPSSSTDQKINDLKAQLEKIKGNITEIEKLINQLQ